MIEQSSKYVNFCQTKKLTQSQHGGRMSENRYFSKKVNQRSQVTSFFHVVKL